jgi:hypothetical protein
VAKLFAEELGLDTSEAKSPRQKEKPIAALNRYATQAPLKILLTI